METVSVAGGNGLYRLSPKSHGPDPESRSMILLVVKNGEWKVDE